MEIASKVRKEDGVAALFNYLSRRVDEHCTHAMFPVLAAVNASVHATIPRC
jgi:hypothetical protein